MIPATYTWSGGTEAMLRFGPDTGPVVIAALPLFEEANRTRTFVVTVLRALAERGVASILPDLPGTGDSLVATQDATIMAMREAYEAVATMVGLEERPAYAFGIRGAALLDTLALLSGRYHLAPQQGERLLHELRRIRFAGRERTIPDDSSWMFADGEIAPVEIAGNLISPQTLCELIGSLHFAADDGVPLRVARVATDVQTADIKFDAAPLWRRAEPGNDPALAALIAADIAQWIAACAV